MSNTELDRVGDFLQKLADVMSIQECPDAELLERFVRDHDEAVFRAIIRRHGPTVLGVCRRRLRSAHDVEDAVQATFLVFVRNAGAIRQRGFLGGWLYSVAHRVSGRLLRERQRRLAVERSEERLDDLASTAAPVDANLFNLLEGEVCRLPAKYRTPIVLCYLRGMTNEEAARELGWPTGTVKGRLARARQVLRKRLDGREPGTLGVLAPVLGRANEALFTPALVRKTTATGLLFLKHGQPGGSAQAARLAHGVLRSMAAAKLVVRTALVLAAAALLTAGGILQAVLAQFPGKAPGLVQSHRNEQQKESKENPGTFHLTLTGAVRANGGLNKVSGAEIYLVAMGRAGERITLGAAKSDADGQFRLEGVVSTKELRTGVEQIQVQVFAQAPGYGYTWIVPFVFHLKPREGGKAKDEWDVQETLETEGVYANDKLNTPLVFEPEVKLTGRVLDEKGKPLAGAEVTGTLYKQRHRHYPGLDLIPGFAPTITAISDDQGFFRLKELPQLESIQLKASRAGYASVIDLVRTPSATAKEPAKLDWKVTLAALRHIRARVTYSDTGKPASGVRIQAWNFEKRGAGVSNVHGNVEIDLPPGDHFLHLTPAEGSAYVSSTDVIHVSKDSEFQSEQIRLKRGCEILVRAIDESTGQGVPGLGVGYWQDSGEVQHQWKTFHDNPKTDNTGELKQIIHAGAGRFRPNPPPDYEAVNPTSAEIDLPAGKTVTVDFKLRRK
jgi:RNA polymerase sigma factor (sigma-70 family)